jgi:hypothetical protein
LEQRCTLAHGFAIMYALRVREDTLGGIADG